MTTIGTSHFVSLTKAARYYFAYGTTLEEVRRKVEAGEIHIGKPTLKPGETLQIIDNGTRYAIEEA